MPPKAPRSADETGHPLLIGMKKSFRTGDIGEPELMRARAAYFACVSYFDEIIGDLLMLLAADGLLDHTIVVYTSDHGELAGEHGIWWKHSWHEAATRVPWYIQTPEHRAGKAQPAALQTPVSLADLLPTLCGLCEAPPPAQLDGVDLSAAVRSGQEPVDRPVFSDNLSPRWGQGTQFRMLRQGRWKYVGFADAPELLFDLQTDPLEQHNLAPGAKGQAAQALARMRTIVAESMDFPAAETERQADQSRHQASPLPLDRALTLYAFPDGRLVDADAVLYHPRVISAQPASAIIDWPCA